ncbi:MAG: hypothetical protein K1X63_13025 [Chitinophagales bacterium]|nr:hypothetical protein [Chitinophagales bacterium]
MGAGFLGAGFATFFATVFAGFFATGFFAATFFAGLLTFLAVLLDFEPAFTGFLDGFAFLLLLAMPNLFCV